MADRPPELAGIVERYRQALVQMGIRPEKIYVFGSYARGAAREGSDIDLVVISPDLAAYSLRERQELLGEAAGRIMEPVQARGFTPDEIAQGRLPSFWKHILEREAVPV